MNILKILKSHLVRQLKKQKLWISNKDIYNELQTIKKIFVLKEINKEAITAFVPNTSLDFSKEGLLFETNAFMNSQDYIDVRDTFLLETAILKIDELNSQDNYYKVKEVVINVVDLLSKVSEKQKNKKLEILERLYFTINNPNCYDALDIFFEHIYKHFIELPIKLALSCLSYLIYKQDYNRAEVFLKLYLKKYGLYKLSFYAPVANFAYKKGYKNKKIKLASDIFEKFEKGMKENLFEKYIKGKHVAIVGNGPQELNTKNGSKIDSYEEVIRFNDFDKDKSHYEDYGKKVTVWSKNGYIAKKCKKEINVRIARTNLYLFPLCHDPKEYVTYKGKNKILVWFPDELWFEIKEKYNIYNPTGGFEMVYWVKKINNYLSAEDCFGFSFSDDAKSFLSHYYNDNPLHTGHSIEKEKLALREILSH